MEKMKNLRINIFAIIVLIAILAGCNGSSDIIEPPGSTYKYTLNGVFVQDVNVTALKTDSNNFAATMTRNTVELQTAQLFFGNSVLGFDITDSIYTFTSSPRAYKIPATTTINIADAALFGDTVSTFVLDSLSITNSPDPLIPNTNGTPIFVEWSSAANIDGYVVAVVLDGFEYTNIGYSAYVTEMGTSTTIPGDAFRINPLQTNPDTGWYNIYVYGYHGSPDVALSSEMLPVAFPSQLSNNINHANLTGNFGSITVSSKAMIHVVSN